MSAPLRVKFAGMSVTRRMMTSPAFKNGDSLPSPGNTFCSPSTAPIGVVQLSVIWSSTTRFPLHTRHSKPSSTTSPNPWHTGHVCVRLLAKPLPTGFSHVTDPGPTTSLMRVCVNPWSMPWSADAAWHIAHVCKCGCSPPRPWHTGHSRDRLYGMLTVLPSSTSAAPMCTVSSSACSLPIWPFDARAMASSANAIFSLPPLNNDSRANGSADARGSCGPTAAK
mmetsp:Transcript_25316/g.88363  ORF Transcript_25316/g.88363 Transcript_25316/m.88363 type:complete len:223 (-) Transcript_25316:2237-2905(-)